MHRPELSIVIPVYNSAGIAPELVARIHHALAGLSFEIVMVNDGSKDDSWPVVRSLALEHNEIVAVNFRANMGQDNAILAGLRQTKGAYVVIMDDDLQHDPDDIPALLEKCKEGYDIVYSGFKVWNQSVTKKAGSRINGGFARYLLGKPRGLYLSPFKILTRALAKEVAAYSGLYPYIDGIILTSQPRMAQVITSHHPRYSGKGNYNLKRSAGVWFRMFTGFSVAPLRIATALGLLTAITGIFLGGYYLYEYFFSNRIVEGWTTLVLLMIFFGGLILMVLGLIGEYLGRIYLTISGRAQYSIAEIIRHGETDE
jgi:undecaprenyl-phosphate 4-deoxy-4-formamido-L-arabinose transferase